MMNQLIKIINCSEIETLVFGLVTRGQIILWHLPHILMMIYMVQGMQIIGKHYLTKTILLNGTLYISLTPELKELLTPMLNLELEKEKFIL
jgi:hypothetical protein